jgi:hypothetical protein
VSYKSRSIIYAAHGYPAVMSSLHYAYIYFAVLSESVRLADRPTKLLEFEVNMPLGMSCKSSRVFIMSSFSCFE